MFDRKSTRAAKTVEIALDAFERKLAAKLGEGDLQLGVRRAVALSGLRLERSGMQASLREEVIDPLTAVTDRMSALAAEFRERENDPVRREEIATQITRLGKLYLEIVTGTDGSLNDR